MTVKRATLLLALGLLLIACGGDDAANTTSRAELVPSTTTTADSRFVDFETTAGSSSRTTNASDDGDAGYGITAEMVVDAMGPDHQTKFCELVAAFTDGADGDTEFAETLAYSAFVDGYSSSTGIPAREAFNELLSRC